jgi:hypothetical protein
MARLSINSEGARRALACLIILVSLPACGDRERLDSHSSPDDSLDASDASRFGSGGQGQRDGSGGGGGSTSDSAAETSVEAGLNVSPWDDAGPGVCVGITGLVDGVDVWSDARGPFVLAASFDSGMALLHRQDGTWNPLYSQSPRGTGVPSIVGFPGGDLVIGGVGSCGAVILSNGTTRCSAGFVPEDFFVVSNDLAYALTGDRALVYDGSTWTQFGEPFETGPVRPVSWRLWAGHGVVIATMDSGDVYISRGGAAFEKSTLSSDVPGIHSYPSTWGFAGDDLWVGDRQGGLFSYDGAVWTQRDTLTDACGTGIKGMWGADRTLYLHTDHRFARYSGGRLEVLANLPCTASIRSIWGNSPSEVYLAIWDSRVENTACGGAVYLQWTGTALVRL